MKALTLFFAVLILFFSSCKEEAGSPAKSVSYVDAAADTTAVAAAEVYDDANNYDRKEDMAMLVETPPKPESSETKIIKSGRLRFQTDDLDESYVQIKAAVQKYQAIIKNDSQQNNDYELSRNLNVRIPNQYFDAFIADISKGVKYFDQKEITSEDVTEEYIDVASRIKTKKALEQRYLELLKKANKVSEMLEIEGQLSEIREEIEAKEGRLRYLQNRVAMSTLDIQFYKPVAAGRKATVSYGGRIGNALIEGFNGISNFFIAIIENWPVMITLVVLIFWIRKRWKRKNK
ncbi:MULTISPECIES: DUF4349 domain-containing protein [Flavobacterium]|uniref:DUF4349 domain-containing protein n=1 Tax=Flavobacterium sedimenticola TaxID=3043286 RepID=A0ABT6XM67_9FLAO|nr:DUF4349 domain-containing protein [Flavobacterium sedimenticola]MDI9256065.1 DUF4349 domain-containing protein [Flavobacterium sedimenticola]